VKRINSETYDTLNQFFSPFIPLTAFYELNGQRRTKNLSRSKKFPVAWQISFTKKNPLGAFAEVLHERFSARRRFPPEALSALLFSLPFSCGSVESFFAYKNDGNRRIFFTFRWSLDQNG
jgi:hypothetical protein